MVFTDGRWVLGDPERRGGAAWSEFRPDGLLTHARDGGEELLPWERLMDGVRLVVGGHVTRAGSTVSPFGLVAGLPGPFRGRGGGRLHLNVRHPYDEITLFFDRHRRWYPLMELSILEALLGHLSSRQEWERLADEAWLTEVVERLSRRKWQTTGQMHRSVTEALDAASGTAGAAA
ncbi:hypothetical protein ACIRBX_19470 [Kitasatospora sp. NPDC096147]|uniref:hypothetical protein n=1 Tax=Kitasatospora sp. NPDC096147 TaxID=3364093 RepID=UPI003805E209